jgi:post-segregation antitoxin (ccd killing protein)
MDMATRKISVTVDAELLDELRRREGPDVNLSAIVNDALKRRSKKLGMLALLAEMERENPSTPEDIAAGEELWQRIVSSSIPEPSRRSRKTTKDSSTSSKQP